MGQTNDFLDAPQIAPLVQRLDDPVPEVRIAAFEALTRIALREAATDQGCEAVVRAESVPIVSVPGAQWLWQPGNSLP